MTKDNILRDFFDKNRHWEKFKKKNPHKVGGKAVRYVCLQCDIEEDIS